MMRKIVRGVTRLGMTFLLVLFVYSIADQSVAYAGDQEGVAGYKFKIYDADGDGIDGNEPNYNSGPNASSFSGSTDAQRYQQIRVETTSSLLIVRIMHWAFWFR